MSTVLDGWVPRHRISVGEYQRMVEVGVLSADMRVELIEGEIVDIARSVVDMRRSSTF